MDAFDRIREVFPKMPVIICTGFSMKGHRESILKQGNCCVLQKPFKLASLANKIMEFLAEARREE